MNVRLAVAAFGALLLLTACESAPATSGPAGKTPPAPIVQGAPPPPSGGGTMEFRAADFAWSQATGTGAIIGQVTHKAGGQQFGCVDQGVILSPETAWVKRRMEILYLSSDNATLPAADVRARTPPERNADYNAFVKRATCDATGRFTFTNLPDGTWYVISVIRSGPGVTAGEMAVMRRVVIRNGNTARVNL
jgi:hypothetical protein